MRKERGITLIALVVTIVVLLILAGVSISMLTGENGIITQAQNSKEATEQARVEELVDLAVNSLISENQGSTSGITPEMVAEEVNEMENRNDIYAEGSTFPTNIIFPEEGRKVEVNLEQKEDLSEMYEVPVDEEDIAPLDLFDYEIIDEVEIGSVTLSELPTKKARIKGIKEEYCNGFVYGDHEYEDTNYEIIYEGTIISDTLVVPYKVDGKNVEGGIEGEMYTITEVQLNAPGEDSYGNGNCFPEVETVIYPNTVEKIFGSYVQYIFVRNVTLKTVILPNNLKTIGDSTFSSCSSLTSIAIPESVTSIGSDAFVGCSSLKSITIPDSVTNIGGNAFYNCESLTNITIPNSVITIGRAVFGDWTSTQTINVPFKEGETPEGWNERWNEFCNATINYLK